MINTLINAAHLAEALSAGRHMDIKIVLQGRWVRVEGLLNRGGTTVGRTVVLEWSQLTVSTEALEAAVREVEKVLTHLWRTGTV